ATLDGKRSGAQEDTIPAHPLDAVVSLITSLRESGKFTLEGKDLERFIQNFLRQLSDPLTPQEIVEMSTVKNADGFQGVTGTISKLLAQLSKIRVVRFGEIKDRLLDARSHLRIRFDEREGIDQADVILELVGKKEGRYNEEDVAHDITLVSIHNLEKTNKVLRELGGSKVETPDGKLTIVISETRNKEGFLELDKTALSEAAREIAALQLGESRKKLNIISLGLDYGSNILEFVKGFDRSLRGSLKVRLIMNGATGYESMRQLLGRGDYFRTGDVERMEIHRAEAIILYKNDPKVKTVFRKQAHEGLERLAKAEGAGNAEAVQKGKEDTKHLFLRILTDIEVDTQVPQVVHVDRTKKVVESQEAMARAKEFLKEFDQNNKIK